jgi:hypothetical protein
VKENLVLADARIQGSCTEKPNKPSIRMMRENLIRADARIYNSLLAVCAKTAGKGISSLADGERIVEEVGYDAWCLILYCVVAFPLVDLRLWNLTLRY